MPPAPERVSELMNDLITYLNRDDVPVLVQAAIGHAQFESIHAFTDGNGRIGRALVSAVLRRRGVTRNAVVPLASGLLARREDYFAALGFYRQGQPSPLILLFAQSARAAALASRETIARLKSMPVQWNHSFVLAPAQLPVASSARSLTTRSCLLRKLTGPPAPELPAKPTG